MQLSIKIKILLALVGSLFLLTAAILVASLTATYSNSSTNTQTIAERTITQVEREIVTFFNGVMENTAMLVATDKIQKADLITTSYVGTSGGAKMTGAGPDDTVGRAAEQLCKAMADNHPSYRNVFIGTKNGAFILGVNEQLPAGFDPRGRSWYKAAKDSPGSPILTKAYLSAVKEPMVAAAKAITRNGEFLGATGIGITLLNLIEKIESIKIGQTGYVILMENDGVIITDPKHKENAFKNANQLADTSYRDMLRAGDGTHEFVVDSVDMAGYVKSFPSLKIKFVALVATSEIAAPVWETGLRVAGLSFVTLILISIGILFFLNRQVITPLNSTMKLLQRTTEGDYTWKAASGRSDEIGKIFSAMDSMGRKIIEVVTLVTENSQRVAGGSREMAVASQGLSERANQQASSLEEVSSSMEQMASNISANATNASETETIANQAANDAESGGEAVTQTVNAMQHIAEKISIVEEIARQTNLLALNAAIEAARAGEHGKGFAVVAAEVRQLAERSGSAAAEISELSTDSVQVAMKAGDLLSTIVPAIKKTADLVQEISRASNEQNDGAQQINEALQQLDGIVQQNASASEEMASTSNELATQANELQNVISFFKVSDESHAAMQTGAQPVVTTVARSQTAKSLPQATPPAAPQQLGGGVALSMDDASDGDFERF